MTLSRFAFADWLVLVRLAFVRALDIVAGRLDARAGVHLVVAACAGAGGSAAAARVGATLNPGVGVNLERRCGGEGSVHEERKRKGKDGLHGLEIAAIPMP
ncbi:MAG TPA: hypothetical protein VGT43_05655 [Burkholderiales bacterium]|nr:hypothetical protein [Burkholderiales bacterium]